MGEASQMLFGGSNSKSSSSNQAFPYLKSALGGTIGQGTQAGNAIASLFGLGDPTAQRQSFQNFRDSTGYQFGMDQGTQAITGNMAAKGLLNSGATLKGLQTFGQGLADQSFGNYLGGLQSLLGSGLQGAGILAGAGNVSSSKSTEHSGGLSRGIGAMFGK